MAAYFDRLLNSPKTSAFFNACGELFALILIVGAVAAFVAPTKLDAKGANDFVVHLAATALLAWGISLAWALYKRNVGAIIGAMAGGYALCFLVGMTLVSQIAVGITTAPLIAQIKAGIGPDTEILAIGFSQSLPFYTGKRMRVMGTPDELAPAKVQLSPAQRGRWFFQIAPDLRRLMLSDKPVYCVIRRNNFLGYEQRAALALAQTEGRVFEIVSNDRFVILGNVAAARRTPPQPGAIEFDQMRKAAANLDAGGRELLLQKGKQD